MDNFFARARQTLGAAILQDEFLYSEMARPPPPFRAANRVVAKGVQRTTAPGAGAPTHYLGMIGSPRCHLMSSRNADGEQSFPSATAGLAVT